MTEPHESKIIHGKKQNGQPKDKPKVYVNKEIGFVDAPAFERERRLCERAQRPGAFLRAELAGLNKLGVIGDARGRGLLLGIAFAPLLRVLEEEEIEGIVSIFRDSLGEALSDL